MIFSSRVVARGIMHSDFSVYVYFNFLVYLDFVESDQYTDQLRFSSHPFVQIVKYQCENIQDKNNAIYQFIIFRSFPPIYASQIFIISRFRLHIWRIKRIFSIYIQENFCLENV